MAIVQRNTVAILCGAFALLAMIVTGISHAAVGRTQGSFNVSPTGAASYTIPIFTPPGPNGVQPSVALVYNSNSGFGYAGKGWSLAGFSAITGCAGTLAQDGWSSTSWSRLCLDGNRLRLPSGVNYGQGGSNIVYATELADFSRITSSGQVCSGTCPYWGPLSWTVERKDGLIYTYGGTTDSRVTRTPYTPIVAQWLLSEIQDRNGNKVVFTYKEPDGTTKGMGHPVKIEWTQTSASSGSYVYRMDFTYTPGGNAPESTYTGYEADALKLEADLLTSISISVSGTVKRKYLLGYEDSSTTDGKLLTSVTECADASGTDCLSPTEIEYAQPTPGFNTSGTSYPIGGSTSGVDAEHDYNGDGIKDLTYKIGSSNFVRLSIPTGGYDSPISAPPFAGHKLLGNAADQMFGVSGGYWQIYKWNGSGFSLLNTSIAASALPNNLLFADMNGDGRDDLVYVAATGTDTVLLEGLDVILPTATIAVRYNQSTPTSASFSSPVSWETAFIDAIFSLPLPWEELAPYFHAMFLETEFIGIGLSRGGDLDGDGRDESNFDFAVGYCLYYYGDPLDCGTLYGSGMLATSFDGTPGLTDYTFSYPWLLGNVITSKDVNGDGCEDRLYSDSSCDRIGVGPYGGVDGARADWNGDGLRDFVRLDSGGYLLARPLLGDGTFASEVSTGIYKPDATQIVVVDANGDGRDDIGVLDSSNYFTIYYSIAGERTDVAIQFKDGYDVEHNVSYESIVGDVYMAYTDATYPLRDVVGGKIVVSSVEATDGAGDTFTTDYEYFGGVWDATRRAFHGFEKVETVDSRNSVRTVRKFHRTFPYVGMLVEESVYQPVGSGGGLISQRTVTPATTTLDSTTNNQRYFPYPASSTEDVYEVGGSSNGAWITRTAVSNTFDSWGNLTASTRTVTDKDSNSPWYTYSWVQSSSTTISPNTTYWCLGLPTATSVTSSTTTGEASVTRSKSFSPDYEKCRMNGETVEPASSTLRVDTEYEYDGFGNVDVIEVTGRKPDTSSMTTRTSSLTYNTTGQFPVSGTNALGQTTTRTFDSTFGSLLTETDPNGIVVVTNTYDSFGRPSRVQLADGTATDYEYLSCAATSNCLNGDLTEPTPVLNRMNIHAISKDSSNSTIRHEWQHLDQFDRAIVTRSQLLSGGYSRVSQVYDTLGRVEMVTPPCDDGSCTQYWKTNVYDLLGRISQQVRPLSEGASSTFVTTTFGYEGRKQTIIDPYSKVTTKILDVNGWMRQSKDHDNYTQTFAYDAAGSLKQVTDSLSNTLFTANYSYGIKPFQTGTTDMDLGSWSYSYNSLGELLSWTDAKSQSFSQTYDSLSRVTTRTESEGTTTFTFGTSAGNHNIGRLASVSMTENSYSEALSYDSIGRLSTRSINADSSGNDSGYTYAIDFTYNTQGLPDIVSYPTSTSSTRVKVKYGYAYGMLQSVTDWTTGSAGTVYWTADTQNVSGQITQETLGNDVETARVFDAVTGLLISIQSDVGGGTGLQNHSYAYDAIGNVTQRQAYINAVPLTESFYYDNLYRLDYSTLSNGGGAVTNLDLTYDAMGNITARSDVNGGATWTYHGSKKHAVATTGSGGASYSYDANGNMTGRDGQTIGWSSYNYPTYLTTGTETTGFLYGPDRQYFRQDYTGPSISETTYYIGGLLEKVDDGSTIDWRHNIIANGQVVAIVSRKSTSANAVHYMLEDNQGSLSNVTNSSGTSVARVSYGAFGLQRDGSDWDGGAPSGDLTAIESITRRGYTGHSMLGRMGLIHMNGRVYDAIIGRFASADPYVFQPDFTQGFNRYAYVNNNPLSFIDPSGFAKDCPIETPHNCDLDGADVTAARERCTAWNLSACGYYMPPTPWLEGQLTFEEYCAQHPDSCFFGNPIRDLLKDLIKKHKPDSPATSQPQSHVALPPDKSLFDRAREWYCRVVPPMRISLGGLETQIAFFTVGFDFNIDVGITTHLQLFASGSAAAGGGAGLGVNFLGGVGMDYGPTESRLSGETGATVFASLGAFRRAGGGNVQFSGDSGSANAAGFRGPSGGRARAGVGIGGGIYAGAYAEGTVATPSACGD